MSGDRIPKKLLFRWLPQTWPAHRAKLRWRDKAKQGLKRFRILESDWYCLCEGKIVWRHACQDRLQICVYACMWIAQIQVWIILYDMTNKSNIHIEPFRGGDHLRVVYCIWTKIWVKIVSYEELAMLDECEQITFLHCTFLYRYRCIMHLIPLHVDLDLSDDAIMALLSVMSDLVRWYTNMICYYIPSLWLRYSITTDCSTCLSECSIRVFQR